MFKIMYNKIIDLVNKKTGLDIRKRSRKQDYVFSRCIYYDIAYNHLKLGTLYEVGKQLGLDHATVIHSLKNILPILDNYAPEFITIRDEVLDILDYDIDQNEDHGDVLDLRRALSDLREKNSALRMTISELKAEKDLIEQDHNESVYNNNEDIKDMIRMIREVPEDKVSTLKTRLEPIIYMICR